MLQASKDFVAIDDVMKTLSMNRQVAAKVLSRWQQQGWLKRVRRGLYVPIPLDASGTDQVLKDPWVLVPALFAPAYIGGWTAAEHWDFTEQLFRSICVFTARPFRTKEYTAQGVTFTLKRVREGAMFGLKTIWRGQARISIADKHRTVIDLLADPATGGGIRHVAQCLQSYLSSSDAETDTLIRYADEFGNGAVFKRLGFLVARMPGLEALAEACRSRLTAGNAKLDPAIPCRRLVKTWRLWIPKNWEMETTRD